MLTTARKLPILLMLSLFAIPATLWAAASSGSVSLTGSGSSVGLDFSGDGHIRTEITNNGPGVVHVWIQVDGGSGYHRDLAPGQKIDYWTPFDAEHQHLTINNIWFILMSGSKATASYKNS